jgi:4-oxalocrotonate tautomerase family enzyme
MPVITVEGPVVPDLGKKRQLVQDLTKSASEVFGLPKESIVVILHETSPECVGVAGELVCDRQAARGTPPRQVPDA